MTGKCLILAGPMKKRSPRLFSLALCLGLASPNALAASPGLKGTLSLVPGLGQMANGNGWEGLGWLGSVALLYGSKNAHLQAIGWDLWMYNMYDAYRDARPPAAAGHSLFENYTASLNPLNLLDPVGAPVVAYGALAGSSTGYPALRRPADIIKYGFVGLGEEGLFRGFLFPSFSQTLGSKWAGAITSSAVFAVAHVTGGSANLQTSALTQRFIGGMVFCLQADRNRYDLRKNIFAHAWYDILVSSDGQIRGLKMELPIP